MKKLNLKQKAAVVLVGLITLQTALTGCDKNSVHYNTNETGNNNIPTERDGIGAKLDVPIGCNESINVGNSGLESISIVDDYIFVPDTDKMDIVHFTPIKKADTNYKKKIVETLLEKDKGIYVYNLEQTKDASEQKTTELEGYPVTNNYEENTFIGMAYNIQYVVGIDDSESADDDITKNIGLYTYFTPNESNHEILNIRPYEGAANACWYAREGWYEDSGANAGITNQSDMTAEEAEYVANKFLADLGITNIAYKSTKDLLWEYTDKNDEVSAIECDGYSIQYTRAVGGETTYNAMMYEVDNFAMLHIFIGIPAETFKISVYDGKVIGADWTQLYHTEDSIEENVELLSYKEIIEKANTEIAKYYEKYPTRFNKIEFNDVQLSYYIVSDGDGKCKYIPVWIFSQYEEYADSDGSEMPKQIVILNAVDGTFVDIVEEAKAMGTYYDYGGGE